MNKTLVALSIFLFCTLGSTTFGQESYEAGSETLVVTSDWTYLPSGTFSKSNIIVGESGSLSLSSQLVLAGNLSVHGTLASVVPVEIFAGRIMISESASVTLASGSKIFSGHNNFSSEALTSLKLAGIEVLDNPAYSPMADALPTCGNGSGQTPFTINASVVTNFNGFQVSCNGANDGIVTVSISGGIGPFFTTWFGGSGVQSGLNYTQLGAGTYTVLVTDQGQGITCVDNVQVTVPSAVTVFSLTSTPPSCIDACNGTGVPIAIGGTFNFSYAWSSGETTQNAANLCNGPGSLTVTDSNGCSFTQNFLLDVSSVEATLDIENILCFGTASGSATVIPSGGSGAPYSAVWSSGGTGLTETGLIAGSYTVIVSDAAGCEIELSFEITEEPPLEVTLSNAVNPLCGGDFTGLIEVNVTLGTPAYAFAWTGPNGFSSGLQNISGLEAGNYSLTVTDANGCQQGLSVELTAPQTMELTASSIDVSCFGLSNGAIDLSTTGGSGFYTFQWTGPGGFTAASEDLTGLVAGSYSVTATDTNGCEANATFDLTEPTEIVVVANSVPVNCTGQATGEIAIAISGGTPGYVVSWTGPGGFNDIGQSITGLLPGTYIGTVTDANGCSTVVTITLIDPAPISVTADATPVSCSGAAIGTITLTISGGTPGYTTAWTGPGGFSSNNQNLSGLAAGTYNAIVTDSQGCFVNATADITEPDPILVVAATTDVSCGGANDGEINLTVSGGLPGYFFAWAGPTGFSSNNQNLSGLAGGDYTITVTDASGCQTEETFVINENPPLEATVVFSDVTCSGANDGTATLTITGGSPNYTISWTGPGGFSSVSQNLSNLAPGTYTATISDAAGCTATATFELIDPLTITVDAVATPISCFGEIDGTITLTISGGTPGYTTAWTGPGGFASNNQNLSGLVAGTYNAIVTDSQGCFVNTTAEITEPDPILVAATTTDVSCGGANDGEINLTVSGGLPGYFFAWAGPTGFSSNNQNLSGLAGGDYTITVTDASGCQTEETFVINENPHLEATVVFTDVTCSGANDGSATLTITGGTPNYTISWTGPGGFSSVSQNLSNLAPGTYTATISDAAGCTATATFELIDPLTITVDAVATPISCFGEIDGTITLTISGGTPGYTTAWIGPGGFASNNQNLSGLAAGTYNVIVTDSHGCFVNATADITEPEELTFVPLMTQISCGGANDGAVSITVSGGVPAYVISWTGPGGFVSSDANIVNLGPGDYNLTITDASGCQISQSFTLAQAPELVLTLDPEDISCFGENDGNTDLTIEGGVPVYLISWTGPGGFVSIAEDISNLAPGTYQVQVIDSEGCSAVAQADIQEPLPFVLDNILVTQILCAGETTGAIELQISGGSAPINISWNVGGSANPLSNLGPGTYSAVINDNSGCQITTGDIVLTDPNPISLQLDAQNILCFGENSGTITTTVLGGTGSLNLSWSGPGGFVSSVTDLSGLVPGNYTVIATDENGCSETGSITINEPTELSATNAITQPFCPDDLGAFDLTVTGGTAPYSISWSGPGGFTSDQLQLNDLVSGTYELTVTDENGCQFSDTFILEAFSQFELTAAIVPLDCSAQPVASIVLTLTGGSEPYILSWTGPSGFVSNADAIFNLAGGTYDFSLLDANGCALDTAFVLVQPPLILVDATVISAACNGPSSGSISLEVSGGVPPFSFQWSGPGGMGSISQNISNLGPGDYTVIITDNGQCPFTETYTLTDDPEVQLSFNSADVSCGGLSDGQAQVVISGGSAPFSVSWVGPSGFSSNSESITNLATGTYSVTVTDANGCVNFGEVVIVEPAPLEVIIDVLNPTCNTANGVLTPIVTGGTGPYEFIWTFDGNVVGNVGVLDNVPSGIYEVEITDTAGCILTETAAVSDFAGAIEELITPVSCNGLADGSVQITITDGNPPFLISWTGPGGFSSSDQDIFELGAGDYALQVTDTDGCILADVFPVSEPEEITSGIIAQNISCFGSDDGQLELEIFGGTAPYTVSWTGPNGFSSDLLILTDLVPGAYTVDINDTNGCTALDSVELFENNALDIDFIASSALCFGATAGGFIEITVSGGQFPYVFSWTLPDGSVTNLEDLLNIGPDTYELIATDALGCEGALSVTIAEAAEIVSDFVIISPTCLEANGSIEPLPSGGTPGYSFNWTDITSGTPVFVSDQANVFNLTAGLYEVLITDALGCTFSDIVPLSDQGNDLIADITSPLCFGGNDGSIALTVSGLTDPVVFDWTGPNGFSSAAQNISDLLAGTYTIVATDALGCVAGDVYDVTEPDALSVVETIDGLSCPESSDGSIEITSSGGTEPYTVLWIGPGFTSDQLIISGLSGGCYELFLTDANGCAFQDVFCIIVDNPLDATAVISPIICGNAPEGAIDLTVTGGGGGNVFQWVGPGGFSSDQQNLADLFAGQYDLLITDSLGCFAQFAFIVDQNTPVTVSADVEDVVCFGQFTGSISASVSGGAAPLVLSWEGPDGFTLADTLLLGLGAGGYIYSITDSLGCFFTDTLTVAQPSGLIFDAVVHNVQCFGQNNGSIALTLGGTTPGFDIFWTGPNGFSTVASAIADLAPGAYQASVTDTLGCISNFFFDILEPSELVLDITSVGEALCAQAADGFITTQLSGGNAPYQYEWFTGLGTLVSTDPNPTGLLPGFYELTVTDSVGCTAVADALIDFLLDVQAIAGPDTVFCQGPELFVAGLALDTDVAFWTDEFGNVVSDSLAFGISLPAGQYTFVLHAGTAPCEFTDTLLVTVLALPTVDAGPNYFIFPDQTAVLGANPTTDLLNSILWTPPLFLNNDTIFNPTVSQQQGDIWYFATVTAPNGCTAIDSAEVALIPPVTVPSGFSPNGDGFNEVFQILDAELYPSIKVDIYNRWGALLFRSEGYKTPWDGRHNDAPLPIGTYYYVIEINEPEFRDTLTGPVTIIR